MEQCQEKVKYYYDKYESAKQKIDEYKHQIHQRDQIHKIQLESEKQHGKNELDKERNHWITFKDDLER